MLDLLKSVILGIVQGLTEFLPVSSSGHLILFEKLLNYKVQENMNFEVILHLGSLLAVILYFRKDIFQLIKGIVLLRDNSPEMKDARKTALWLLIATLTTTMIALPLKGFLEKIFHNVYLAAAMLSLTGIIVFCSDKISAGKRQMSETGLTRSLLIGLGQAIAIIPGISRSGTTITCSLLSNLKREQAARFSFLLSIPAILGAALLTLKDILQNETSLDIHYLLGGIASFISGYLVISLLLTMIKKQKLRYFAYYCWSISIISIVLLLL